MKVLLVEDNEDVSCIGCEYLRELGHEPEAVSDGEQALVRVRQTRFDAVITDLKLPGISGLEIAAVLAEEFPDLCIVISSGYEAHRVKALLGDLSRVKVLPKPYDLAELQEVLA